MTCCARSRRVPGRSPRPCPSRLGEAGVRGATVLGAGEALDQAPLLQAADDVREPRQGGVRPSGQRGHPQRALRGLGEHREHEVLEVGEVGVAAQLGVQDAGQQLEDRSQPDPGPDSSSSSHGVLMATSTAIS